MYKTIRIKFLDNAKAIKQSKRHLILWNDDEFDNCYASRHCEKVCIFFFVFFAVRQFFLNVTDDAIYKLVYDKY